VLLLCSIQQGSSCKPLEIRGLPDSFCAPLTTLRKHDFLTRQGSLGATSWLLEFPRFSFAGIRSSTEVTEYAERLVTADYLAQTWVSDGSQHVERSEEAPA